MAISGVTSSQNSSSQSSAASTSAGMMGVSANEGTFLTLLVSQLKNQDPLNPSDSTQFVGELAQFSSLEQLININQSVGSIQQTVAPTTSTATTTPATSGTQQA